MKLIHVIYDGIDNPVFDSQVAQPLANLARDHASQALLITFEYQYPSSERIQELVNQYPHITIKILKKYRFWGIWSLHYAQIQLQKVLSPLPSYHARARGPIAGWLCMKAASPLACKELIIQARGLLAAEYEYTHHLHRLCGIRTWLPRLRLLLFKHLEYTTYHKSNNARIPVTIEAVSPALQEHLIRQFGLNPKNCTIAKHDIPKHIDAAQRLVWRGTMRKQLNIPESASVFCYNGSVKPWQCPQETVALFQQQLLQHPESFLLVLTQDTAAFLAIIQRYNIPRSHYRVMHVPHHEIFMYLAACDIGILLREQHLMNWISRPTKALEYRAAGMSIMHNNTVAFLSENHMY
ncbi:hypothetical protein KJZ61_02480 [Candidatus Dependentiae bacterium]|nr:hypothetical protein [Candidatus Dependentiae bacterium]